MEAPPARDNNAWNGGGVALVDETHMREDGKRATRVSNSPSTAAPGTDGTWTETEPKRASERGGERILKTQASSSSVAADAALSDQATDGGRTRQLEELEFYRARKDDDRQHSTRAYSCGEISRRRWREYRTRPWPGPWPGLEETFCLP